jgi:hypothetical protein
VTELCEELDTYQSQVSGTSLSCGARLVTATRTGYFNVYRVDPRMLTLLTERLQELSKQ